MSERWPGGWRVFPTTTGRWQAQRPAGLCTGFGGWVYELYDAADADDRDALKAKLEAR